MEPQPAILRNKSAGKPFGLPGLPSNANFALPNGKLKVPAGMLPQDFKTAKDPQQCAEYVKEIFEYLRVIER